jgi:hypothetical protein
MENYFKGFTVAYIERNKNTEANDLVNATTHNTPIPAGAFFQVIEDALVKTVMPEPRLINVIEGEDWRAPIMAYLYHYCEPDSINEQIRMQQRARDNQIVDNNLYKAFASGPLLWCLSKAEGQELLCSPHRNLRRSYRCPHASSQSPPTRVLLASYN